MHLSLTYIHSSLKRYPEKRICIRDGPIIEYEYVARKWNKLDILWNPPDDIAWMAIDLNPWKYSYRQLSILISRVSQGFSVDCSVFYVPCAHLGYSKDNVPHSPKMSTPSTVHSNLPMTDRPAGSVRYWLSPVYFIQQYGFPPILPFYVPFAYFGYPNSQPNLPKTDHRSGLTRCWAS